MSDDIKGFKELLDRAELTIVEAAHLFKTSRPTIYSWRAGHQPRHQLIKIGVRQMMKIIQAAVGARRLPLSGVKQEDRLSEIMRALKG